MYDVRISEWDRGIYRLWCLEPGMKKLMVNRDVTFDENVMPYLIEAGI